MKNLRPIFIGAFVALGFGAQPVDATTYDIALKEKASVTYVHSNGTLTVTATATNKGPDAGPIFIVPQAMDGLSINSVTCSSVSSDGYQCEFSRVAPGQSVSETLTFAASPTPYQFAFDAWFVSCASGDQYPLRDPVPTNDCAVATVRVLP